MTWQNGLKVLSDNKELVPEFFFDPSFLINNFDADLGLNHLEVSVQNVELPAWAESPRDFVLQNLKMLDNSDITPWINLIFGIN